MKILLVITKGELGGAQTSVLTLARACQSRGIEVAVASGEGDYLATELKKTNIPYHRLNQLKRSFNPITAFAYSRELKQILVEENIDVVHFNSTNTLVASKLTKRLGVRSIFTVRGLSMLSPGYRANFLLKFFYRIFFRHHLGYIDEVVFVSNFDKEEAIRQRIVKKGVVIYNGLDIGPDYFLNREQSREELAKLSHRDLSNTFIIGSIGRLAKQKNYQFLISNWPKIKEIKPDAKLLIIGEGPERGYYERLIKDLGIEADVILLGPYNNASKLLKGFDLFILPSIYEGLSISLIEVLFAQIPVIASDIPGNVEVVGVDNCYLENNISSLLEKLNNNNLSKISSANFTVDRLAEQYIKSYAGK